MTFEARIDNIKMVVAMFMGTFRGGSVGAAEGYKFVEAAQRAARNGIPSSPMCTARPASASRKARTA